MNMSSKSAIYAVKIGLQKGIYKTWDETLKRVKGVKGAKYKKFKRLEDANCWLEGKDSNHENEKNSIIVYTDGSCQSIEKGEESIKLSSFACYFPFQPKDWNISEFVPGEKHTSPRSELYAVISAIKIAEQKEVFKEEKILHIYTDCTYPIGIFDRKYKPTKNFDIVKELYDLQKKHEKLIQMHHVPGHSGVKYNEIVDKMCENVFIKLK